MLSKDFKGYQAMYKRQLDAMGWTSERIINEQMRKGVEAGMDFDEFMASTGCPSTLRYGYIIISSDYKRKPDPFIEGWNAGQV
jgi:hypothetical protein